jgi:hypothetical protein
MPRSRKEPKPEDLLMQVIRVAEILAEAQVDGSERGQPAVVEPQLHTSDRVQKTQN